MPKVFLLFVLSGFPGAVFAHGQIEGLNEFYNGLLHPIFVPLHILVLVALGLLVGQQGLRKNRIALITTPIAIILGLAGTLFLPAINLDVYLLVTAIVLGLLIVTIPTLAWQWSAALGVLTGFLVGLDSSQESLNGMKWVISAVGNLLGIGLLILNSAGLADYSQGAAWKKVGVRVMGSWLTASAFLVFALNQLSR